MTNKTIKNKEQLSFNVQLNLDLFMEANMQHDPNYMDKMSVETSQKVEELLNEELQGDTPIEKILKAEMISKGIKEVAAMEILAEIKTKADIEISDDDAREVIKQIMTGNIRERLETDAMFIEIDRGKNNE